MNLDDMELVRQYAQSQSEAAFARLVGRHVNLVYSVAFRLVRDAHLAEEITQTAFVILARKAGSFGSRTVISGWLCQTARYVSARALTIQRRRHSREQESYMQSQTNEKDFSAWDQIEPLLESAMAELGQKDHHALVLRFFDGRSFQGVGVALGTSEAAAKMRVNRALEKLRRLFARRGVTISSAAIAAAVAANSIQAAPIGLAASTTAAVLNGNTVTISTLTLIKTTLKIMAWSKLKTTVLVGAILLLAAGTATITVHLRTQTRLVPLAFVGYATPEAAMQSTLWTASQGDFEQSLEGLTPEEAERFRSMMAGKPASDISRALTGWAAAMRDCEITKKEVVSADEVHLHLHAKRSIEGLTTGKAVIVMQRIGDEWKKAGDVR